MKHQSLKIINRSDKQNLSHLIADFKKTGTENYIMMGDLLYKVSCNGQVSRRRLTEYKIMREESNVASAN